ncbi:hypothetical protein [Maricaulis sp.]|uniref:hypothetical protein n=1 Tax=Maricaulis sp. TaxID=1486257 RepID=UPI00261B8EA2|nr:hypothetical protein [Maricaulis sp.]
MPLIHAASLALALAASDASTSAASLLHADLAMGAREATVRSVLDAQCSHVETVIPDRARFPLAAETEAHLVCDGFTTADGAQFVRGVFVVADGHLVHIELFGDAAPLSRQAGDALAFGGWTAYPAAQMLVDAADNTVHIVNEDGLHTNLFAWHNPLLRREPLAYGEIDVSVPREIRPGTSIDVLRAELDAACPILQERDIDPPSLPAQPATQTQINCFGYVYAGFERKIEFVFGDGTLVLAWILTGEGEADRLQAAMDAHFGAPDLAGTDYRFYEGGAVAQRFDKPEVLVIEPQMGADFMAQLAGHASD